MKTQKLKQCKVCDSTNLKRQIINYPLTITGKTITIGRVATHKCIDCKRIHPTKAGFDKINRLLGRLCISGFLNIDDVKTELLTSSLN